MTIVDVSYSVVVMSESQWHRLTFGAHLVATRATIVIHPDGQPPGDLSQLIDRHRADEYQRGAP